jgi:hypothetical protein
MHEPDEEGHYIIGILITLENKQKTFDQTKRVWFNMYKQLK